MPTDQIRVKKDGSLGPLLRDLRPQFTRTKLAQAPGLIEALYPTAPEALLRISQKFEILGHRDYVFLPFPLRANLEILQDFVRPIGLERPFDQRPEPLFDAVKVSFFLRDV
jgi:hypothetical protein